MLPQKNPNDLIEELQALKEWVKVQPADPSQFLSEKSPQPGTGILPQTEEHAIRIKSGDTRFYVKGESKSVSSKQGEMERETWFETKPLTDNDIKGLTTLQLITYSRGTVEGNDDSAGIWTWFELRIRKKAEVYSRELPNGQFLAWFSHPNSFGMENSGWHRGRIFTEDDDMIKHLRVGDIISARMSACFKRQNSAEGYLLFGYGIGPETHQKLDLHGPRSNVPTIYVYGQERRDCLMSPTDGPSTEMEATIINGGVDLMSQLLSAEHKDWEVYRLVSAGKAAPVSQNFHSVVELAKVKDKDKTKIGPSLQIIKQTNTVIERSTPNNASKEIQQAQPDRNTQQDQVNRNNQQAQPDRKIILWDDFGTKGCFLNLQATKAELLIYQMHAPLWEGELWKRVCAKEATEADAKGAANPAVLVVIDSDDLRAQGIRISRGISWEKTMEDFDKRLQDITKKLPDSIHLLVSCGYEGVIWVPPRTSANQTPTSTLFDPNLNAPRFVCHMVPDKAEGDLLRPSNGRMPGIDMAFVTGLAASLVRESDISPLGRTQIGAAVAHAIAWSHRFASKGFCKDTRGRLNYPMAKDIDNDQMPKPKVIYGDSQRINTEERWSLFNLLESFQDQVAAEVVKLGTKRLATNIPTARYGKLQTADRVEIEGFRSTAAVVQEYIRGNAIRPLSIAVFGQPGAGKSFGVKEVIGAVLKDCGKECIPIEANLSQFREQSDLVAIFDEVRDKSLKGDIPVVLFDEFDSDFKQQGLGWLKYFLAPMQDGQFLNSGSIRLLGRAIFVFIGGTSSTFKEFRDDITQDAKSQDSNNAAPPHTKPCGGEDPKEKAHKEKKLQDRILKNKQAKKPDFVSRLSAHIDVRGPNQSGDDDKMFTMRRAMLLRSLLQRRLGLQDKDVADVDDKLLNALLKHKRFPHGTRSMDLILQTSTLSGSHRFESSALPSDTQLSMHVDIEEFTKDMETKIRTLEYCPVDTVLYNKLMWAEMKKDYEKNSRERREIVTRFIPQVD